MSATGLDISGDRDRQFMDAIDVLRKAEEGDEVLFGDRQKPLEVTDVGGRDEDDDLYIVVIGPNGGGPWTIREDYINGVPNLTTSPGSQNANDLRFAGGVDPSDRLPDWTRAARMEEAHSEGETPGVETPEPASSDGPMGHPAFGEFDVSTAEGEMTVSGHHDIFDLAFTAIFHWTEDDAWQFDREANDGFLDDQDQSTRGAVLADIEDALEMEGFSVNPVSPGAGQGTEYPDVVVPADADVKSGDEFVQELSDDPMMTFGQFISELEVPESQAQPGGVISRFFQDESPSWTFVDEMLAFNHDVPKAVNNWQLVDYGVVTDDTVNSSRQAAWYNFETGELVGLAAIRNDSEGTGWFVYHAEDTDNIHQEEREPVVATDNPEDALGAVKDILYRDVEEIDLSIEQNPDTGNVTVRDAISETRLVQSLVRARSADPYGLRTYTANVSAPQFILDLDDALADLYRRLTTQGDKAAQALIDFADGADLPTRKRIRLFLAGLDPSELGQDVKATLLTAAAGVHERFLGFRVSPVIKYNELGVDVQFLYTPTGKGSETGLWQRLTIPTRRQFGEGPILPPQGGFVIDTLLPSALSYYHVVHAAEWAGVNEWVFTIPDPWADESDVVSFGTPGGTAPRGGTPPGTTVSAAADLSGTKAAPGLVVPERLADEERLESLYNNYSDSRKRQKYLIYLATTQHALNVTDEDVQDVDNFAKLIGLPRVEYRDIWEDDFDKGDFKREVFFEAMDAYQTGGSSVVEAVDSAIFNYDDENSATSKDFTKLAFKKSDTAQAGGGDDGDLLSSTLEKLDEGIIDVDDLTDKERELVVEAERERGVLSAEQAEKLKEIRGGPVTETSAEELAEHMDDYMNEVRQMEGAQRARAPEAIWDREVIEGSVEEQTQDVPYGERDDDTL